MSELRIGIGYSRVSKREQADQGHSIHVQPKLVEEHGLRIGAPVVAHYRDVVSGRSLRKRPELEKALAHVCEVKGVLIGYSLSRVARSAGDAEWICGRLMQAGADLASVSEPIDTSSAMGRAFFGIVSVFARLESDLISERVRAVKRELLEKYGFQPGGIGRLGRRDEKETIAPGEHVFHRRERPEEQAVVADIIAQRRAGAGIRGIAAALNERGVPTVYPRRKYRGRPGAKWHPSTVMEVLRAYAPELARQKFCWTNEMRALLGTANDVEIAARLGCGRSTVTSERKRLGIRPFHVRGKGS